MSSDNGHLRVPVAFLRAVMGAPLGADMWAHVWRRSDSHTYWFNTPQQLAQVLSATGNRDIYYGIGLASSAGGIHERIRAASAAGVLGVLADLDIQHPVHKQKELPKSEAEALAFLGELELPPSLVIHSGHGVQAWWLFEEPWHFESDVDRQRAVRLGRAWDQYVNGMAWQHGWVFDSVGDLPRVFRIPGSTNIKDDEQLEVRLISSDDSARYSPSAIERVVGIGRDTPLPAIVADDDEVDPSQRFTRDHPCPICGGAKDDPQGQGIRCWGFMSRDRQYAHCSRDEHAGALDMDPKSRTYAHRMGGQCRCGQGSHGPPTSATGAVLQAPRYPLDDTGNAQRFADKFGRVYRYDHDRERWHYWDGVRWAVTDKKQAQEAAKTIAVDIFLEAMALADDMINRERRKALFTWAKQTGMEHHITKLLKLATSLSPIATVSSEWDADRVLVAYPNGYLNLRDGSFKPPWKEAMITRVMGAPRVEGIRSTLWESTLQRFLPDPAVRQDFQTAVGYCMSGRGKEHMFIAWGGTKRGKSTILGAVRAAFGEYAQTVDMESFTSTRPSSKGGTREDLMALLGKRLAVASEASETQKLDAATLKMLLGGTDKMSIRGIFGHQIAVLPTFGLWLLTNELPKLDASDDAMWERLHVFKFDVYIPPEERDETERDHVTDAERTGSAVLAWAEEGWWRYKQAVGNRLALPTTIAATSGYRSAQDAIAQFIELDCVEGPTKWCRAVDFRAAFQQWLSNSGAKDSYSDQKIGRSLSARGYETFQKNGSARERCWKGIGVYGYEGAG